MKVCIDKGTNDGGCCKAWAKGIRTINNQYPDDNREFGILEGTGILITPETAGIRITCTVPTADTISAGDNIDISPGGSDELVISLVSDPIINGDIQINGDIIQNGSAYETHAEQIYTTKDYIITRDGAISALSAGDYSGFQVKKYDGTNDGRLVIDNAGVARVGDVGDEQPLLTRDESADLTDGESLVWDATNQKAITEAIPSAINTALAGKQATLAYNYFTATVNGCTIRTETYGKTIIISCQGGTPMATGDFEIGSGLANNPYGLVPIISGNDGLNPVKGYLYGLSGKLYMRFNASGSLDVGFRFVGLLS